MKEERPVKEEILMESEDVARKALKECSAFLTYQGQDPWRYNRARLAATMHASYTRLRATISNEETNRIALEKLMRQKG